MLRASVRRSATRFPEAVAPTSGATRRDCSGTCAWTPSLDGSASCRRTPTLANTKAARRARPRAASASSWTGSAPPAAWDVSAATPGGGSGTCSVVLRSSLVIWKHLQGNVAFTFLSFVFFSPCGTGNPQHQLFYYYLGRGGMVLSFVCF